MGASRGHASFPKCRGVGGGLGNKDAESRVREGSLVGEKRVPHAAQGRDPSLPHRPTSVDQPQSRGYPM